MSLEEDIKQAGNEGFLSQKTEIGEAFEFLQNDEEDKDGRPKIDFNTRLSDEQISGILSVDTLQEMGLLPSNIKITRTLKRLSVSRNGEGRKELVSMAQGLREESSKSGFFSKMFQRKE